MTGRELHEFFKRHCVAHNVAYPRWEPRYEPVWSDLANELTDMGVSIVTEGTRVHMHRDELDDRLSNAHDKGYSEGHEDGVQKYKGPELAPVIVADPGAQLLVVGDSPLDAAASSDKVPHEPLRDLMRGQGARPVEPRPWWKLW